MLLSFRNTRVSTVVFYASIDNIVRGDQEKVVVGFRNFCVLKLREINHNKLSSAITGSNFDPEILNGLFFFRNTGLLLSRPWT